MSVPAMPQAAQALDFPPLTGTLRLAGPFLDLGHLPVDFVRLGLQLRRLLRHPVHLRLCGIHPLFHLGQVLQA